MAKPTALLPFYGVNSLSSPLHVKGIETVFGICPEHADMHWDGLDYSVERFEKAIAADVDDWKNELELHSELFAHLGERLPKVLIEARSKIEKRLNA